MRKDRFNLPSSAPLGLTLIEVALILVILGLLIGMGAGVIGFLTKRAKIIESRETVEAAVEALISYAAANKCLTENKTQANLRKESDAWNQPLFLRVAPELLPGNCSLTNGSICDRSATSLQVVICKDATCSSSDPPIENVAFVVASKGPNYNLQIENGTNEIIVYAPGVTVDSYSGTYDGVDDPNRREEFDDIVKWVTLDELRTKIACPGAQLRIITTELPFGYQNQPYFANILAEGGVKPLSFYYNLTDNSSWSSLPSNPYLSNDGAFPFTGTPYCPGSYTLNLFVEDNSTIGKNNASRVYMINIQPDPLKFNPFPGTTWYVQNGSNFNATITVSGGNSSYISNCVPSNCGGLTCTSSGYISGTADIGSSSSPQTCTFTVTATDNCPDDRKQTATAYYTVVINPPLGGGGGGSGGNGSSGSNDSSGGGGSGSPPSCTLTVASIPIGYNQTANLYWTIYNGPAYYSFSLQSGNCTTGSNSTRGSCTTDPLTGNIWFYLEVSNFWGSGSCSSKVCVENQSRQYRVWNLTGEQRYFKLPNGECKRINNKVEITSRDNQLTPGTQIVIYRDDPRTQCNGTPLGTFSYKTAVCLDDNGDGEVNLTGPESGSDE